MIKKLVDGLKRYELKGNNMITEEEMLRIRLSKVKIIASLLVDEIVKLYKESKQLKERIKILEDENEKKE